jgi:hypothetical protein
MNGQVQLSSDVNPRAGQGVNVNLLVNADLGGTHESEG